MSKKCTQGLLLEARVDNSEKNLNHAIARIEANLNQINENITDLFNHQSSRIPPSFAWVLAGLSSLLTAVITAVVTAAIK